MLVLPNSAANLAQTEDVVTKYSDIVVSHREIKQETLGYMY